MSEVLSTDWWLITILAAIVGGWGLRAVDRFLITAPLSWLHKKRKTRKRGYIIFISELSTNQNMFQLMSVESNFRLAGLLVCAISAVLFTLLPELREHSFISFHDQPIPSLILILVLIFLFSIRPFSEVSAIKRNMYRAIQLDFIRKQLPANLEDYEVDALKLKHEELETATDEQINVLFILLGCNFRSRLSNFLRFKLNIRI